MIIDSNRAICRFGLVQGDGFVQLYIRFDFVLHYREICLLVVIVSELFYNRNTEK